MAPSQDSRSEGRWGVAFSGEDWSMCPAAAHVLPPKQRTILHLYWQRIAAGFKVRALAAPGTARLSGVASKDLGGVCEHVLHLRLTWPQRCRRCWRNRCFLGSARQGVFAPDYRCLALPRVCDALGCETPRACDVTATETPHARHRLACDRLVMRSATVSPSSLRDFGQPRLPSDVVVWLSRSSRSRRLLLDEDESADGVAASEECLR